MNLPEMQTMNPAVRELVASFLLSKFEPLPLRWSDTNERESRVVVRAISKADPKQTVRLQRTVNRNSFLLACLDLTEDEEIEHLIVGYGQSFRNTTKIQAAHHVTGASGSVGIPEFIQRAVDQHWAGGFKNEVLVFHSHPKNFLNLLIDNLPIASSPDRNTAAQWTLTPERLVRILWGGGRVLFYLGENGFVSRFQLPNVETILNTLAVISRSQHA